VMEGILRELTQKLKLSDFVAQKSRKLCLGGVIPSTHPLVISALHIASLQPLLVLFPDPESAEDAYRDFLCYLQFLPDSTHRITSAALFPPWENLPYQLTTPHTKLMGSRLEVMGGLLKGCISTVFISYPALAQRLIPKWILAESILHLKLRQEISPETLLEFLVQLGYLPEAVVEAPGQFSRRGGILDIFPIGEDNPFRLEFFGDQIESIRKFNPTSQLSISSADDVLVIPRREALAPPGGFPALLERLQQEASPYLTELEKIALTDEEQEGLENYIPIIYNDTSLLTDYFSSSPTLLVSDIARLEEEAQRFSELLGERYKLVCDEGKKLPAPEECWIDLPALLQENYARRLLLSVEPECKSKQVWKIPDADCLRLHSEKFTDFSGRLDYFEEKAKSALALNCQLVVACATAGDKRRLAELLPRHAPKVASKCQLVESGLSAGFIFPEVGLAITNDQAIFARFAPRHPHRRLQPIKEVSPIAALGDLSAGDICVHSDHGIGVYLGLSLIAVAGIAREFATLEYAGGNKLYVPAESIHKLYRYIGGDLAKPKIDRLGGGEWVRRKATVKKSAEVIARQLLALYAAREQARGFAFSPDSVWQYELEESFPYQETEDQSLAIMAVKEDMEKPKPMDRLIAGDVGYGKTEVAIRAAFKAVNDGKQVALLVPTTVLAAQHAQTFKERLAPFPVRVAELSRLIPYRQQREVVKGLAEGKVDVVIGTHRLLSRDLRFADLGLLIVDEEHRFGVSHKERIKEMRAEVDVIALSATPIPRTLSMSLSGIRDLSIINTPPQGRLPIYTYIKRFAPQLICDAIAREVESGGQVYFVHNRVQSITGMANWLQELMPQVRLQIAHGQLPEVELARIMASFYTGNFDVLVTTTIIESGIDIPSVNTIIINRADAFGLAQLHQLRGRVGRSGKQAFCYLLVPAHGRVSDSAQQRLQAIRDSTELGSGLTLALRDLEIRGAGNLLGAEQSGHISAVGFDTYTQLVAEAVAELRGTVLPRPSEVKVELPLEAYLPENYVPEPRGRIAVYRRLSQATNLQDISESKEMLEDMYGDLPAPAQNLLAVARLRLVADRAGVDSIQEQDKNILIMFKERPSAAKFARAKIEGLEDVRFLQSPGGKVILSLRTTAKENAEKLAVLELLLSQLE
jgi:transcription-repair coupling factor (superfamily II helicase)